MSTNIITQKDKKLKQSDSDICVIPRLGKIAYGQPIFADGTVSMVKVDDEVGAVILESRLKEENLERKERRYIAYSLNTSTDKSDELLDEEDSIETNGDCSG